MESFKLSNKVQKKSMISLAVYNVGRQKCSPSYSWGPGVRDHYLIHYIRSGSGIYRTQDSVYYLHAGDSFLAYPNVEISYQASETDPWTYEWVGFSGTDAGPILSSTDFSREHPVLHNVSYGDDLQRQLDRINAAFGNSLSHSIEMTGELYLLLHILVSHAATLPKQKKTDAENVRRAMDYISSRYSYDITVEDVASYIGVSRSTLFRQFQKTEQLSPKEYLDRFRIQKALALLEQTDLPIASVAQSVGYDNGLYFSKVFRKYMNETPSGYRRQNS